MILVYQGYEESDFWQLLGGMPDKVRPVEIKQYRGPRSPRLYKVCLGSGYLELPQEKIKKVIYLILTTYFRSKAEIFGFWPLKNHNAHF